MKSYREYTAVELALDDTFQNWVKKDNHDHADFWYTWLRENPDKADLVREARQMLESLNERPFMDLSDEQVRTEITHIRQSLKKNSDHRSIPSFVFHGWWRAAAILILLIGLGWLAREHFNGNSEYMSGFGVEKKYTGEEKTYANDTRSEMEIRLPDSSRVTLEAGATLTYKENAASERITKLHGEALFNVTHHPEKPFFVYANGLVTKVLGTTFRVRSWDHDPAIRVTLLTGKVSVFTEADQQQNDGNNIRNGVILTPNQSVDFITASGTFHKALVTNPVKVKPVPEESFEFTSTPVIQILEKIEQAYGIELVYDEQTLKDCALTASLSDESMKEKIQLICAGINATYEEIDARIIITSKGCH